MGQPTQSELLERAKRHIDSRGWEPPERVEDAERTLYKLELHRVELELQNETLHETHSQLEKTSERYRALYELAPVSLITLDADGLIVEANKRALVLLGRSRDALLGQPLSAFVREMDAEHFELHLRRVRADEEPVEDGFVVVRSDGPRFRARFTSLQVPGEPANPVESGAPDPRVIVAITDREQELASVERLAREVVAHKHSRSELDATRTHLQAVVDAAGEAIVTIDPAGTIEFVNPMVQKMFGYSRDELIGRNLRLLMPSPHRDAHDDYLASYDAAGESDIVGGGREVEGRHKDGTTFPIHVAVSEMMVDGARKFTGMIRDLTEEKALEKQLVQAQRMEAIGTLATGVAHDFNNLLMGIGGCLALAAQNVAPESPAQQYLDEARRSLQSGAAIASQLLSFGRRHDTTYPPCDVDAVVDAVQSVFGPLLGEEIRVETELGADGVIVRADRGQLEQILLNLAINARDAMPAGGTLRVETDVVELAAPLTVPGSDLEPGEYVCITVEDTGHGIPSEIRNRIFEPFFTTKSPGSGTGLGLSMVFGTLRSLGGGIRVDSDAETGTTFELLIPVADASPVPDEMLESDDFAAVAPRSCRVLVVEDDRLVAQAVRQLLTDQGHRPIVTSGVEEARRVLEEHTDAIDLILTDSVLADGFGADVAAAAEAELSDPRIIFMSAHSRDALLARARVYEEHPFVQKPFDRARLQDVIVRTLAKARRASTPIVRRGKILTIDDQSMLQMVLETTLSASGYDVVQANTITEALALPLDEIALVITDVRLPDGTGPGLAEILHEQHPDIEVIQCSGLTREIAMADYGLPDDVHFLMKPFDLDELLDLVGQYVARPES